MVVGVVLDREGRPLCSELWPGNTTDVKTLLPVVARLKERFGIGRLCIVADRGMISAETIARLEEDRVEYILGVRMRRQKEIREEVLSRAGRSHEVDEILKVKEVLHNGSRYLVCLNEEQARKDALDREAIISGLREQLSKGTKALIGNKGYRKYVRLDKKAVTVDEEKIASEARFDGKWVLTTNTSLKAEHVARQYKQLWTVEQTFRTMKSVLNTRPVYHRSTAAIRGHVFSSFLSLVMMNELKTRLERKGWKLEWHRLICDLDHLKEIRVSAIGKDVIIRTELRGDTGKVFQAAGVAIPPTVKLLNRAESDEV